MGEITYQDAPQTILAYLNRGATAEALDAALYQAGLASQPVSVAAADFTGDGEEDYAVSIFDPTSTSIPPEGRLLLYVCQGEAYALASDQLPEEDFPGAPHLWYWQDMNADGAAELVLSNGSCGAHTCYERFQVLLWDGTGFVNRMESGAESLPYPDAQITDFDGDGLFNLEITGSGIASVGAGPQRSLTLVWSFDPAAGFWVVKERIPGPSDFRIHALHDADATMRRGDYQVALALYLRVATDPNLQDWEAPQVEQANLGAFARYRMLSLQILMGDETAAQTTLSEMESLYPPDSSQHAYVEMAALFRDSFQTGGLKAACAAVELYAMNHPQQILEPLGFAFFGYANPEYTAQDMCPE